MMISTVTGITPSRLNQNHSVYFISSPKTGTPTPLVTLTTNTLNGLNTIDDPQGISFNSFGDLAVANDADNTIAGFDHTQLGKSGSPIPRVFFAGTNTMLNAPTGLIFGPNVR
jgi:hypothetical protein